MNTPDMEKAVRKQSVNLQKGIQKVVDEGASFEGLLGLQAQLADLLVLYGSMRGKEAGEKGAVTPWRMEVQDNMVHLQRKNFNSQTSYDASALILAKILVSKAMALGEIAYLEKEIATLKTRKEKEAEE